MRFELLPNGDRAIDVIFPNEISQEVSANVLAMCAAVDAASHPGIVDCIPAYHTLLVEYDPAQLTYGQAAMWLRSLSFTAHSGTPGRTVTLPVCYGGAFGPELDAVAVHAGLSAAEVVRLHTDAAYRVYMLGFRPGFPFLGGMNPRIATPRRKTPRVRVEGGSVGIAGPQTGLYPEPSPGGWNIIGRTPVCLYDHQTLALLQPGDTLRFAAVSRDDYDRISEKGGWLLW